MAECHFTYGIITAMSDQVPEPKPESLPEAVVSDGEQKTVTDLGDVAILADGGLSVEAAKKILEKEIKQPPNHGGFWG